MELFLRIKKYLFLLAFVIALTLGVHVVIVYFYDEAEQVAERGGIFSIGLTGTSPSLNPTQYGLDSTNDFVLHFLYRGLLRYDSVSKVMVGDLANCDISKNLAEVRCYFKSGAVWSDGSKIGPEDVLATYSLLAETDTNKKLGAALSKFAITKEGAALVFRSTNPSAETLQLLTIPVIKKSVAEKIRNDGVFKEEAYSGFYTFDKRESDPVRMSENISLVINNSVPENNGYSRILIKVYGDTDTLFAQKDALNLIFPAYYGDTQAGNRFEKGEIFTPDFAGVFLNSEKLTPVRRRLISGIIQKIVESPENKLRPIKNPFFTESTLSQTLSGSLESEIEKAGYYRKSQLMVLSGATVSPPVVTPPVSNPVNPTTSSGATTPVSTSGSVQVQEPKKLKFFDTPTSLATSSIPYQKEVALGGSVPTGVTGVYINGYRLKGFSYGMTRFTYRASTDMKNLKSGINVYTLSFEKSGVKEIQEVFTLDNGNTIPTLAPAVPAIATPPITEVKPSSATGSTTASGNISTTSGGISQAPIVNPTPTVSTGTTSTKNPKTPSLKTPEDSKLYYKNGTPVKLTIRSLSPKEEISDISKQITTELEKIGFTIDFDELETSSSTLTEVKNYEVKKNYDLFITGVNLGYLGTYIMPYFHSGQVQNGFNFSLLRNPTLDILLEDLKTKDSSGETRTLLFEKINTILKKESVLVPLGTRTLTYYIDKNIQDFEIPSFLPSAVYIDASILKSYINRTYIIQLENKSISKFFIWCKDHLFSPK